MKYSKRGLSIDTDPSIHLHSSTHLTTTTHLNFPSTDLEPSTLNSSIDLSKLTISQMNQKNQKIYKAVLKRIEKQNEALANLEIEKLKIRVLELENRVNTSGNEKMVKEKKFCSGKCPLGPSHSLVRLKSELKEMKYKKKMMKSERDEVGCELRKYKKMNKEMRKIGEFLKESPASRSNAGSCIVF